MDKTAYKIARRLLAAGAEIHVVARKLDLPVSEIRLLDRLMREQRQEQAAGAEVGPNYKPTETVPRRKIVRDRIAPSAEKKRAGEEEKAAPAKDRQPFIELGNEASLEASLDEIIEREIALL